MNNTAAVAGIMQQSSKYCSSRHTESVASHQGVQDHACNIHNPCTHRKESEDIDSDDHLRRPPECRLLLRVLRRQDNWHASRSYTKVVGHACAQAPSVFPQAELPTTHRPTGVPQTTAPPERCLEAQAVKDPQEAAIGNRPLWPMDDEGLEGIGVLVEVQGLEACPSECCGGQVTIREGSDLLCISMPPLC